MEGGLGISIGIVEGGLGIGIGIVEGGIGSCTIRVQLHNLVSQ